MQDCPTACLTFYSNSVLQFVQQRLTVCITMFYVYSNNVLPQSNTSSYIFDCVTARTKTIYSEWLT
jgi:hypothetical protein